MKSSNHPKINHEIVLVYRDEEIIISLPNGKEIATLTIETMEDHSEEEPKPTKNFWVKFNPKRAETNKFSADVWVDE